MSPIAVASACASVALSVGVLGGVCGDDVIVLVCLLDFVLSSPKTLPIVYPIGSVSEDARRQKQFVNATWVTQYEFVW